MKDFLLIATSLLVCASLTGCEDPAARANAELSAYTGASSDLSLNDQEVVLKALASEDGRAAVATAAQQNPLVAFDGGRRVALILRQDRGDGFTFIEPSNLPDPGPFGSAMQEGGTFPFPKDAVGVVRISDLRFEGNELHYTTTDDAGTRRAYWLRPDGQHGGGEIITDDAE